MSKETRYDQPLLVVGRNAAACQIVFDRKDWPMVSRQHAEFRLQNGRWFVADSNSTHGTFLDGEPLKVPTELRKNSRVQFGTGGPVLVVTGIELKAESTLVTPRSTSVPSPPPPSLSSSARPASSSPLSGSSPRQASPSSSTPSLQPDTQKRLPETPARHTGESAFVELSGAGTGSLKRIELSKDVTRFGRDAGVEGAIDAAAAAVSRRHAEIRRLGTKYVLVDLGSFNGTALNGRRIAAPEVLYHHDSIELGHGGPTIRFIDPAHPAPRPAPQPASQPSHLEVAPAHSKPGATPSLKMGTMVLGSGSPLQISHAGVSDRPHVFMERSFGQAGQLSIGRGEECDIRLDGLLISNRHASVSNTTAGVTIEDLSSSNGTYINGERITGRKWSRRKMSFRSDRFF